MKRNIKVSQDYIPMDCWNEAKEFYLTLRDDVDIYKKFKIFPDMKPSEEAEKFAAWFTLERFVDYPRSLILIYEHMDEIDKKTGDYGVMDGYGQLQFKLIQMYRLLKENGMIDE